MERTLAAGNSEATQAMQQHWEEVQQVAASVRSFHARGEKFRIFHGSTNSTRPTALGRDPRKVVDTSRLSHVLAIDTKCNPPFALVEPNVPMDQLVEATLEHGLIPPVVMEFPGITVGGGYAGTAGESSSFRHGFFDRTLDAVEMVLANGDVVTCSETEHADLFRGAGGAVGTFGVVTMVKLQLREARRFVEVTYHPVREGMKEAIAMLQKFSNPVGDVEYLDGIMFDKSKGAIITGRLTDSPSPDTPIQRFSGAWDPWFYLHVQSRTASTTPTTDAVPLPDYLFRYDRGGFWVGRSAYSYFPGVPFNSLTRWFLDDFLHTRMMYNTLHASGQSERMIVQDLALPYETAEEFVEFTDERTGIYPLWLCPLKESPGKTMHPHLQGERKSDEEKGMLNIGLWGLAPSTHDGYVRANRDIERKLQELGGMKWLYAQTFHSEDEFWSDFDRQWYNGLREKYHATGLPNVYEKVKKDEKVVVKSWKQTIIDTWPFSGVYGLAKAIQSGDYVRARKAKWKDWVPRS